MRNCLQTTIHSCALVGTANIRIDSKVGKTRMYITWYWNRHRCQPPLRRYLIVFEKGLATNKTTKTGMPTIRPEAGKQITKVDFPKSPCLIPSTGGIYNYMPLDTSCALHFINVPGCVKALMKQWFSIKSIHSSFNYPSFPYASCHFFFLHCSRSPHSPVQVDEKAYKPL